jgi:glyoxylase-like metal-dependent hydrolase (beta-lactamase superfamily II)
MQHYICLTCGTQYPASENPPDSCPICEDERQYIGHNGQEWTTLAEIQAHHKNEFFELEPGLVGVVSEPRFAIGQRGVLVQSPDGNILWDCITLIDDDTIAKVNELGGISKIAISHPHYYSTMIEWSHAFDAPIYIHESERQWVMRPDDVVQFWQGETLPLSPGLTLIRCGGHYIGSQVLHWADSADGKGVLLTGDTLLVVSDRRYVSFMSSYPNYIPMAASKIRKILAALEPFDYDRVYSFRMGLDIKENAQAGVQYSAQRYIRAITE